MTSNVETPTQTSIQFATRREPSDLFETTNQRQGPNNPTVWPTLAQFAYAALLLQAYAKLTPSLHQTYAKLMPKLTPNLRRNTLPSTKQANKMIKVPADVYSNMQGSSIKHPRVHFNSPYISNTIKSCKYMQMMLQLLETRIGKQTCK